MNLCRLPTQIRLTPEVLHDLQGREDIGRISAKPGESLKTRTYGNLVFSGLNIIHHPGKCGTAFNGFAGLTSIFIFGLQFHSH